MFIASFYCYLNYDQTKDFVIDLRNVWNWLGFSRIEECKRVLVKHFTKDLEYKISSYEGDEANPAPPIGEAGIQEVNRNLGGAGKNKEKILLTVRTFKKLCIKSNTKKADEVHEYFVKLEDIIFQTLNEETNELRSQIIKNNKETGIKIREKAVNCYPLLTHHYLKGILIKLIMNGKWVSTGEACEFYGVAGNTIRRWADNGSIVFKRTPGGPRRYFLSEKGILKTQEDTKIRTNYIYVRVSSSKQREDMDRQEAFLRDKYPDHQVIKDVGKKIYEKRLRNLKF